MSQYISSLVPSERGFVWSLKECYYGNKEKDRKPVKNFINIVNEYPGLFEIMLGIEGCITSRSSHASGVIFTDEDPYEHLAYMKTPKGEIITQFDLHDSESVGATKYDLLVTAAMDKISQAIYFLQEDKKIDPALSLREVYEKYLHPDVIDFEDEEIWKSIKANNVLSLFQFDSIEGSKGIKAIQPENLTELSNVNGLIRLVAPDNSDERPIDKYKRFKANPQLWYDEMHKYGLTEENIKTLEKYYKSSYGISISQENFLFSLGDEGVCGWDFSRCNDARRVISKKKMDKLPILKEEIIRDAATPELGRYYWDQIVLPISSYAFSDPHALAYAMVAYQMALIATKWNPIYWNTACLVVNSGSLEENESEIVDIYEKEDTDDYTYVDLPDRTEGKIKTKNIDYKKMATAIGDIKDKGINISLININESDYGFKPDVKNNRILYGLKALSNINVEIIEQIKNNRPYSGIKDFMKRCPLSKIPMINLIKSGAFDEIEKDLTDRKQIMVYYLLSVSNLKDKLNLRNFNGLMEQNLVPKELELQIRIFNFTKYLKAEKKYKDDFVLDDICIQFIEKYCAEMMEVVHSENNILFMNQKIWDKFYQFSMDAVREWLKDNQQEILTKFNNNLFLTNWKKYASGTISSWEMDSLCFYYHEHELKNVNLNKYGISQFNDIKPEEIEYYFKRGDKKIPIYKLSKIIGTVIAKDDIKNVISLLTLDGVVTVKFTRDYYSMFKKQISKVQQDGTKKVIEKSWFKRGTILMITGYKKDDIFIGKTYKNTESHQLYKINEINGSSIKLQYEREKGE